MAIYEFRCEVDGLFERMFAIGAAPDATDCPQCGRASARAMSAPSLRCGMRPHWFAAMDRAEKSRHEPDVVRSLPPVSNPRRITPAQMTPALRQLPRP